MKEDITQEELIEVPFTLPRLFIAPSCLPKFSMTLEAVARKKAELLKKTNNLRELATRKKDDECVEKLDQECAWMRLEIEALENEANEMRKELVGRIYLEVRSVKEMMAVNDLTYCGSVAAETDPGMPRSFRGKICTPVNMRKDVMKAIRIVQRSRQTF